MASTYFRIPVDLHLLFHSWGSEVGVYNCTSGETHLLEEHAANLLQIFDGKDRSGEFLVDYLAGVLSSGSQAELEEYLETVMSQFGTMGLIEECGGDSP